MSVLIKGMKMPGVCHDCRFAFYGTGGRWWCAAEGSGRTIEAECAGFNSNSSPDWCPLVEVPDTQMDDGVDLDVDSEALEEWAKKVLKAFGAKMEGEA